MASRRPGSQRWAWPGARTDRGACGRCSWVAGVAGFGAAIGVHVAVGYTDLTHLGPAILGAVTLAIGLALWRPIRPV